MKNYKSLFITMMSLLFVFQNNKLFSDVTDVGSIAEMEAELESIYSLVEEDSITTGIMYGKKISFAEFSNYRGVPEDSILSNALFRQIYSELTPFMKAYLICYFGRTFYVY